MHVSEHVAHTTLVMFCVQFAEFENKKAFLEHLKKGSCKKLKQFIFEKNVITMMTPLIRHDDYLEKLQEWTS